MVCRAINMFWERILRIFHICILYLRDGQHFHSEIMILCFMYNQNIGAKNALSLTNSWGWEDIILLSTSTTRHIVPHVQYTPESKRQVYALYAYVSLSTNAYVHLSLNSWEKIFCHTSIHFCCWFVRGFPGVLKDRVMISRSRDRRVLITTMVFQSDTANRARLPSMMKTPAYI